MREGSLPWRSAYTLTGVVTMTNSTCAALPRLRNVLFCSLLTLGLAACGADGTSSSSGAMSLVQSNLGVIKRGGNQNKRAPGSNTVGNPTSGSQDGTQGSTGGTPPVVSDPGPSNPPVASMGSATLDWTPPTLNSDGSTLTNLAGYTVYYGTAPDKLTQSLKVANPGLSAFTVSNLSTGTWYFAITAYSSSGTESARTEVISTTI
jgi:hypothetical protein